MEIAESINDKIRRTRKCAWIMIPMGIINSLLGIPVALYVGQFNATSSSDAWIMYIIPIMIPGLLLRMFITKPLIYNRIMGPGRIEWMGNPLWWMAIWESWYGIFLLKGEYSKDKPEEVLWMMHQV
jgi:hypothetical protein